jgi:hypothetical protein
VIYVKSTQRKLQKPLIGLVQGEEQSDARFFNYTELKQASGLSLQYKVKHQYTWTDVIQGAETGV